MANKASGIPHICLAQMAKTLPQTAKIFRAYFSFPDQCISLFLMSVFPFSWRLYFSPHNLPWICVDCGGLKQNLAKSELRRSWTVPDCRNAPQQSAGSHHHRPLQIKGKYECQNICKKYKCKEKIKKDINVKCKSAPGVELSLIAELLFYKVPAHLITINCTQERIQHRNTQLPQGFVQCWCFPPS